MRKLSESIRAVLASDYLEMKDVVEMTIPAYTYDPGTGPVTLPEEKLYLSASEIVIDGIKYQNTLRSIDSVKFTASSSTDGGSFTVENVSRGFGLMLISDRKLDGTKCSIKRAFKTDKGWTTDTIMENAYMTNLRITSETVSITIVSDMSRRQAQVADRSVSQRCIFTFKGDDCGVTAGQPGDALFCDKTFDGDDGCIAHGNSHRYGAVPSFALIRGSGYDSFPNNFPGTHMPYCVDPESYVQVYINGKLTYKKAKNVKKGQVLASIDLFGKVFKSNVESIIKGTETSHFKITAGGYSIVCSDKHRIITGLGDNSGVEANALIEGENVLIWKVKENFAEVAVITDIEHIIEEKEVITFSLDQYYTYIASEQKNGGIVHHNRKDGGGTGRYPEDYHYLPVSNPVS